MYAFVHIEKTAGSTLLSILRNSFGTRHCDIRLPLDKRHNEDRDHRECVVAANLTRVRRLYRNVRGISGHNVKAYADLHTACSAIEFFTFLRDPVKRFLSHFHNRGPGCTPEAFKAWVSAEWTNNWQTKMVAGEASAEKAIELLDARFGFVGLTERFDEGLLLLGDWLSEPRFCPEYKSRNRMSDKQRPRDIARRNSDMSYLNEPWAIAALREANAEDQKMYDYLTATLYPAQVARYAGDLAADTAALKARNQQVERVREPLAGTVLRNYIYKPLLHLRAV